MALPPKWTPPHHSGRPGRGCRRRHRAEISHVGPERLPWVRDLRPIPVPSATECAPLRPEGERRAGPGADAERRPQNWGPQALAQPRERGKTGRPSPTAPPTERKMPAASSSGPPGLAREPAALRPHGNPTSPLGPTPSGDSSRAAEVSPGPVRGSGGLPRPSQPLEAVGGPGMQRPRR